MPNAAAVDLLYSQLGALPDPEFGVINLLPFAQETPESNAIKRRVCEGIVRALEAGGYTLAGETPPSGLPRVMSLKCRSCGSVLLSAPVDKSGAALVPATQTLAQLGQLNPQCPHGTRTLEDQRRVIEEALAESS